MQENKLPLVYLDGLTTITKFFQETTEKINQLRKVGKDIEFNIDYKYMMNLTMNQLSSFLEQKEKDLENLNFLKGRLL